MNSGAGNEHGAADTVKRTQSLCPVCLRKIDADIRLEQGTYYMVKSCPEHGTYKTVVWKGGTPYGEWAAGTEKTPISAPQTPVEKGCPYDCSLCGEHRQRTCTALIEVTQACNLHCRFCFADAAPCGEDPSLEQIAGLYRSIREASGTCNIQLSGGEPTLRDDLPAVVRCGKESGFPFIQVNTNGIRLAQDEKFVRELKAAGLDSVFLQFDGVDDAVYRKLRGHALFAEKVQAIENCGKYGIGVVLVPTLVPGTNTREIGKIIDFALDHIATVRGVHFQPVSYFGRVPKQPSDEDRLTLPELMEGIEEQTDGRIPARSLRPPQCENHLCSFHGSFLLKRNGTLAAISEGAGCCGGREDGADKAKNAVSRDWAGREKCQEGSSCGCGSSDWDAILGYIRSNSFCVSAMAFQDAWNIDLGRVRDCCVHVVNPQGKLIPFCMYNLTDSSGRALYRARN